RPFGLTDGVRENAVFNFFNAVYAWMCVGLAVTAVTGWAVSRDEAMTQAVSQPGVALLCMVGLFLFVGMFRSIALRVSSAVGTVIFLAFAAFLGVFLSSIFLVYKLPTIGGAFIMTAGTFGIMSVVGYITKRDLTGLGSYLYMAVIGAFLALLVNLFLHSTPMMWLLTYVILFLFIGLTAYDTQQLKRFAYQSQDNHSIASRMVIVGSLMLYLDFINMFLSILTIFGGGGGRRR
ncbi:MAG TPA: Bax inhibitor-1/YccA family protein, partial [Tepidisphaeraceae bacterium]|nr:Bax inhibitor-1/YccA family protein [Tepidisphaeraceae bacterium]